MKHWEQRALELLDKTLSHLPNELNEIDWKENLSPNQSKLCQHLSAFANYPGGGFLAFGIDNKTAKPIGLQSNDATRIISTFSNLCRNNLTPQIAIEHGHMKYQNQDILIIFVHESPIKPVYPKNNTIEEAYIRSGGTTRKASRAELGSLMLNSKIPRWEELSASILLGDTEVLKLLDHYAIFDLLKRPTPSNNQEVLSWMEKEKMVKKSQDNGYYITNFGAIAAARGLNDFDDLSRKTIRVIRYKGSNKVITEREFPGRKGYAIGFGNLIEFLKTMLPQSEIIKNAFREEKTIYPEVALRELIANALIHQDFTIRGNGPMIEIFDDRIEITNPGTLLAPKKIERLIGTNPESRNELLASAFRRYHICEERGTGFIKSVEAIELYGLPPLKFEEGENYFKVTLFAPRSFAEMSQIDRIEACYQHAVIKFLSNSAMTNTTLRGRFKMNEKRAPMISKLIRESLEAKKIKFKNPDSKSNKYAQYIPYWG